MKAARYGNHTPSGGFPHVNQTNFQHRPHHQQSNSSTLQPPSYSNAFSSANANPFAPTGNLGGLGGLGPGPSHAFSNGGTGLASREAVEGFAYGAQLQQQSQNKAPMRRTKGSSKGQQDMRIRDVWAHNLKEEMDLLEQLVDRYPYISMVSTLLRPEAASTEQFQDTEFPGIVARPMGAFITKADYHYQCLRCNVDLLKVIQLGIALFDEDGNSPPANLAEIPGFEPSATQNGLRACPTTWQFNFQFSLTEDMYNDSSITFLQDAGLDLKRFETEGVNPEVFGSRLLTSGLVLDPDVHWISFHSGYDFAYLVKLMNLNQLPEEESEYRRLMKIYFPSIYDIKFMIQHIHRTMRINADSSELTTDATAIISSLINKGGLQNLADELHVRRVGVAHFAGSDALLTGKTFWEVKSKIFNGHIDASVYSGQIWGLNAAGTALYSPPSTNSFPTIDGTSNTPNLNGATIYSHPPQSSGRDTSNPNNLPSTPGSSHAGTASTPSQQSREAAGDRGFGNATPGAGLGGAFGAFRFGK